MNIIRTHYYPAEMVEEMDRLVDAKIFPSKNAIVREGIKKILKEQEKVKEKK